MKGWVGFGVDQVLSYIAFQYHLKDWNTQAGYLWNSHDSVCLQKSNEEPSIIGGN